ncbi:MAG: class I SAM-dependent methyltransferase [Pseudomonadota bacterium]
MRTQQSPANKGRFKGPVLDVGAGAGRTTLWLQRRGIETTGIDLSPGAVAVARSRGCRDVREADVLTADDDLLPQAAFRTVVLFGNNVGIGGTIEGAATLLGRLARATKPLGRLLVTGLDVANTSAMHHLAYHARNRDRGRPIGEIKMRFEYEGTVGDWVPWFHPEPAELEDLADATGWAFGRRVPTRDPFYALVFEKPQ